MGDTYINDIRGVKLHSNEIANWCRDNPWRQY
jgi:hypothetical protein